MRDFLRSKFTVSDSVKIGIDTALAVAMFAYSIVILQKIAEQKMNELDELEIRLQAKRDELGAAELGELDQEDDEAAAMTDPAEDRRFLPTITLEKTMNGGPE